MWFDQAVWFMVNNLHIFFDEEYPTLAAKFGAFIIWLSDAARIAVRHQITFHFLREMMVEASLEFAADPTAKLLSNHPPGAGIRQIERWIKPAAFSAANPMMPGSHNANKRQRLNINAPPAKGDESRTPQASRNAPRNALRGGRGGRGGYNRRFRPAPQSTPPPRQQIRGLPSTRGAHYPSAPNEAFVYTGPAYRNNAAPRSSVQISPVESNITVSRAPSNSGSLHQNTSPSRSRNEATSAAKTSPRLDRSSMKRRFLDWDSLEN